MTDFLLVVIAIFLFLILWYVGKINERMRERFPTEKEEDADWARKDPMGHAEAHSKDKQ